MDINLLALNLGNSRLAIGVFLAGELQPVVRLPYSEKAAWPTAIAHAWGQISGLARPAVAAAGVNSAVVESLRQMVSEKTGQNIQWIGRDIELPINVLTEPPSETGVDRVLNIAAAYELMGKACIVVDAGTAVTVDVCNDNGDFLGGSISPGVAMMLNSLHEKTAGLPHVEFKRPTASIGNSTAEAIRHGVYHGIRGMVKELAENYATDLGQWPEIIATGGDAQALFADWELIHAVSPDLTLHGIALAYVEHHIRQET